ncbi:MAG: class II fructose-bisphosphate aldolase, partial [Gammaproteobacteria bacterium]|nr:class II fructose-bisphosphate aldolase [Gammaproteobacteria bacterium]
MTQLREVLSPGVVLGDDVQTLYDHARSNQYALPAVNTVGTNSINATLEA